MDANIRVSGCGSDSGPSPSNERRSAAPQTALLTKASIRGLYLPVGARTLDRWIASGVFPKPDISIGAKVRYWRRETVEGWIAAGGAEGGAR